MSRALVTTDEMLALLHTQTVDLHAPSMHAEGIRFTATLSYCENASDPICVISLLMSQSCSISLVTFQSLSSHVRAWPTIQLEAPAHRELFRRYVLVYSLYSLSIRLSIN